MKYKTYVRNMTNNRGGEIVNQFIITTKDGIYFQSYKSIIAFRPHEYNNKIQLDTKKWDYKKWGYSTTTGKYRNQFLNEDIAETRKKIKSGVYELVDLN